MSIYIDATVSEYLETKGVTCSPPSAKTTREKLTEGLITGLNPLMGAANFAINQHGAGAKAQEWTSWKQWALSQPDWPSYLAANLDRITKRLDAEIADAAQKEAAKNEQRAKAQEQRAKEVAAQNKRLKWVYLSVLGCVLGLIATGAVLSIREHFHPSTQNQSDWP